MGTNYYALRHPDKKLKESLHRYIDEDNFDEVENLTQELYGDLHLDYSYLTLKGNRIHLGKRSGGWKFLWNPNIYAYRPYNTGYPEKICAVHLYEDLTKEAMRSFIIQDNVKICDEYGEFQDKDDFWRMALEWGQPNGFDLDSYDTKQKYYEENTPLVQYLTENGYNLSRTRCEFYSDGLRFSTSVEFS